MTYLLGVDAGQTVTKAVLFDADGRTVAGARADTCVSSPHPRWQERDMDDAWRQTASAIAACLRAAGVDGRAVSAVGICGHNDGVYPVNGNGAAVRPAILATDSRAHEYVGRFRADGTAARALPLTGQSPFAGSPAAVYSWLRDHEPAALHDARWLLFCKDWLRFRLTGVAATDPTEASASFTAVADQAYSLSALALYELEFCADKLPPIVASDQIAGRVTEEAAGQTGLVAGTPVVTGAHDVDAAAVGMGAVTPGSVSIMMGTFSINQVVSADYRLDHRWQARSFLSPGTWLHMSTSPSSASNLDWAVRLLGPYDAAGGPDFAAGVAAGCAADPADAPLFLPFLYGSPHGDAIGASFAGVRGWHTREHLLRAVLDGVVFNHRTHLDALGEAFALTGAARLSGGGARSPLWSQLLADVIGMPVEVTDTDEAGARGAAALAGIGLGWYASPADAAAATVRVVRRHQPGSAPVLQERYRRYLALVEALIEASVEASAEAPVEASVESQPGRA
jgi:L-xylulokinase